MKLVGILAIVAYAFSAPASSPEAKALDEDLYSRQLYVLGRDAMKKMQESKILIIGLGGLGEEIAKNVILAGVKSVTLFDETLATMNDMSSKFYLQESDIGKPRAHISLPKLAELNPYVEVDILESFTVEKAKEFTVVVVTEQSLSFKQNLNDYLHASGVKFISADTAGLFGNIFTDFGENFVVVDHNGEEPVSGIIGKITRVCSISQ